VTAQEILHAITGKIADLFASHDNLILYYSCDDMNPIPSRNTKSANKNLSVQEYRSRLYEVFLKGQLDMGPFANLMEWMEYIGRGSHAVYSSFCASDWRLRVWDRWGKIVIDS